MEHKFISKKELEKFLEDNFIELGDNFFNKIAELCINFPTILKMDAEGLKSKPKAINLVIKLKLTEM